MEVASNQMDRKPYQGKDVRGSDTARVDADTRGSDMARVDADTRGIAFVPAQEGRARYQGRDGHEGYHGRDGRDGYQGRDGRDGYQGRDRDGFQGRDGRGPRDYQEQRQQWQPNRNWKQQNFQGRKRMGDRYERRDVRQMSEEDLRYQIENRRRGGPQY